MTAERQPSVDQVFDAWVADVNAPDLERIRINAQDLLQHDATVLACTWSLANQIAGHNPTTAYQFGFDFMQHPHAPALWYQRAEAAGDFRQDMPAFDYDVTMREFEGEVLPMDPYWYEKLMMKDGHPSDRGPVSGIERSLLAAVAYAAYNSASGFPYLIVQPLGPSTRKRDRSGFLRYAGENLYAIGEELLAQERLALPSEAGSRDD